MTRYRLTPSAARDLEAFYEGIAPDSLPAAGRFLKRMLAALERLAEHPGIGHLREDLTAEPLRFWPVGAYLIVYRPDARPIEIIRIIHGARDLATLLVGE